MKKLTVSLVMLTLVVSLFSGCATKMGTGASIGSALGLGVGLFTCKGKNKEACIAALTAAGAGTGALGGKYLDDKDTAESEKKQLHENQKGLLAQMHENELNYKKSLDKQRWEIDNQMQQKMHQDFARFKTGYRVDIPFTTGSAVITTFASSQLDSIARELKQYPDNPQQMMVIVTGYADGTGDSNESLAMRRAFSIKNYLNSKGLNNIDVNYMTVPNGDERARAGRITLR